jgi:hypothetical protein
MEWLTWECSTCRQRYNRTTVGNSSCSCGSEAAPKFVQRHVDRPECRGAAYSSFVNPTYVAVGTNRTASISSRSLEHAIRRIHGRGATIIGTRSRLNYEDAAVIKSEHMRGRAFQSQEEIDAYENTRLPTEFQTEIIRRREGLPDDAWE